MKKILVVFAGCLLVGGLMSSCGSSAEKLKDANENSVEANKDLEAAKVAYAEDMANYRKETAEKLATNDKNLAEFKARIAVQKSDAKADYIKKVAELEQKNSDYKKRLADYKEEGKDKWDIFKAEFSRDMDELGNALKDLTVKNNK